MKQSAAISLVLLAWCSPGRAEQVVRGMPWKQLRQSGQLLAGDVVAAPAGSSRPVEQLKLQDRAGKPFAVPGAWWSDRQAGLLGGIAGSVLGCVGALIGTLGGLGKARPLVMGLMVAMLVTGVVSLLTGVVALSLGQPYAVYYPLLLLGVIATGVTGPLLPTIRRRYAEIELRKMSALDAGGGTATR